ncbi:flavin-dependent dehydrogenase [Oryzomicrobium terrae]|uniref:Flavin-dependent dehydrogenase n=1 Tax=Oryzomicrobium terrae TaxID=1735038 RepID=A0A5C1E946_9RHOO|nr:flavin-dependent dehydrogenase [Oryzomicrobium terrae]
MAESVGAVVIGAGVVGLACARALARRGIETVVVEARTAIGQETSSRNSEVIHAGLYYPAGSLKARLCVAGRQRLYRFCADYGVAHQRCGKLIVATSAAQVGELEAIRAKAAANGVDDLRQLNAAEAQALEPALHCHGALLSPSTGIIDSHGLMLALLGDAEHHGASLALGSPVIEGRVAPDGLRLTVGQGGDAMELAPRLIINAAGLYAPRVASRLAGYAAAHLPPVHFAKGNYYSLAGRAPFSRLIYPVPEPGGLGVHLTLDLGGQARFGPDVEWLPDQGVDADPATFDYRVDPARAERFYGEVRRYWPELPDHALAPAYSGVRPKISGPGQPTADFCLQGPETHGIPGLLHLYGIESPGLTSCLALAELACERLGLGADPAETWSGPIDDASSSPAAHPSRTDPTPRRIVLDTNAVLDLFYYRPRALAQNKPPRGPSIAPLAEAIDSGALRPCADATTLDELARVLAYPEFALGPDEQAALHAAYAARVELIAPADPDTASGLPRCRDKDDQKFVELAARAGALWLVSRDKEVLRLNRRRLNPLPYRVLLPEELAALLAGEHLADQATLLASPNP